MPYLTRGYAAALVASLLILYFTALTAAVNAYNTATQEQVEEAVEAQPVNVTVTSIFLHNVAVTWPLTVPAAGIIPFLWVWWSTGYVIGLLSLNYGVTPASALLTLTNAVFPEFLAYAVMLAENLYVTFLALTRGDAIDRLKTEYPKSIAIYLFALLLGAAMEAPLI